MKSIAVLGANGRVGRAVALAFDRAGFRVITVARSARHVPGLANCEHRRADAMNRDELSNACRDTDFVFNGLNVPYPRWSTQWPVLAENVIAACEVNGAIHLFPGNVYGYGTSIPEVITERSPMNADESKGVIRRDIEAYFAAHSARVQTLILHAGDFFGGSQTGSWFDLLLVKNLHKGRFAYPGAVDCVHAWAYLPDLARAFVTLAEHADRCDRFEAICFEGHNVTAKQLLQAVEAAAGSSVKLVGVPWGLFRFLGLFVPLLREVVAMRYLWNTPHRMDGAHFIHRFGPLSSTPLNQAVAQALSDIGSRATGLQRQNSGALGHE